MFGELKEMAKLASLLKNGPALQAQFEQTRVRLAERTVSAEVGGGAVTVVADGSMRVRSVSIDPALLAALIGVESVGDAAHGGNRSLAESLIAEAVNAALSRVQAMVIEEMSAAASEMKLPIPKQMLEGLMQPPTGGAGG